MRQSGGPPAGNGGGSGTHCWRRLRDWQQAGVRDQSHEILLVRLRAADRVDWSRVIVDSSSIRGVLSVCVCLSLWQPQLIKSFGLTNFQTGLLSSVPFGVATIVMVLWGRSSDRSGERKWHTAIPLLLSAFAMLATFVVSSLMATIVLLSLMAAGSYSSKGPFCAMVTQRLSARNIAIGLAVVSGTGSMASALTTYLFGIIGELTSSYELALLPLVGLTLSGSAVLFLVGQKAAIEPAIPLVRVDETRSIPVRTARESNIKQ